MAVAASKSGRKRSRPLLGAHTSAAGGWHRAIERGAEMGCDVVQLFTKSPNRWEGPYPSDDDVAAFRDAVRRTKVRPAAAHDAYLINPASADSRLRRRSVRALIDELQRAEQLEIPWVVTHLGAHLDHGEETGLKKLVQSVQQALDSTRGIQAGLLLETTAGQGTSLGYRFEHLRRVLDEVDDGQRLGVCLDTCHIFAAGYDFRRPSGHQRVLDEFDSVIGFQHLRLVHANDSQREHGSRVDRHAHIGRGEIGPTAFARLLTDARLARTPFVLETPQMETMHAVNLRRLRRLQRRNV